MKTRPAFAWLADFDNVDEAFGCTLEGHESSIGDALDKHGIPHVMRRSKSGNGLHVFIPLTEPPTEFQYHRVRRSLDIFYGLHNVLLLRRTGGRLRVNGEYVATEMPDLDWPQGISPARFEQWAA